jgi:predicted nucleic-acid-binding Zn-ribbon protein
MKENSTSTISKAELDRFFMSKHVTGCPVCGRFQPLGEVDECVVNCQRISPTEALDGSMTVLVITCDNCGVIQFYDHGIIAEWLQCHRDVHSK